MKLFLTVLIACMGWLPLQAQQGSYEHLNFKTTDGQTLTPSSLPQGKPLILAYFRTDCDNCRFAASQIKERAVDYPAQIWMISPEEQDMISVFEEMNGLYGLPSLTVAQDDTKSMHDWFQFEEIPFYVLFDGQGRQLATFPTFPDQATVKKYLTGK